MRLALTALLLTTTPAWCWWETGHQVVARLAAAHLSPAARTRIARTLQVPDTPGAVADALAKASTWADETKNQTRTGDWHFINLTLQDRPSDIPERCPDNDCATARIRLFAGQLKSHTADPRWSELDALRFLVHFVGDIHQPLHDISDADLGGNCEHLKAPIERARNLHALWDGGIVNAMDLDAAALTASLEADVERMHNSTREKLSAGTQDDWAWEAHELGIRDIYHKLHIPVEPIEFPANCSTAPAEIQAFQPAIDSLYIDAMKPVVRAQLTKGGLRLARLLNETL